MKHRYLGTLVANVTAISFPFYAFGRDGTRLISFGDDLTFLGSMAVEEVAPVLFTISQGAS